MIKVALVSYQNTKPMLKAFEFVEHGAYDIRLLDPAECANAYLSGEVDIALVPVGALVQLQDYKIITDFCIGCENEVRTVCLFSNVKIDEIHTIYLDNHSKSSAALIQILMKEHFKRNVKFVQGLPSDFLILQGEAHLLIGDKVFEREMNYEVKYDLGEEWIKFTSLPFVFAIWIARNSVLDEECEKLNNSLHQGLEAFYQSENFDQLSEDLKWYYTRNISYTFDDQKVKGMSLYLKYLINLFQK